MLASLISKKILVPNGSMLTEVKSNTETLFEKMYAKSGWKSVAFGDFVRNFCKHATMDPPSEYHLPTLK